MKGTAIKQTHNQSEHLSSVHNPGAFPGIYRRSNWESLRGMHVQDGDRPLEPAFDHRTVFSKRVETKFSNFWDVNGKFCLMCFQNAVSNKWHALSNKWHALSYERHALSYERHALSYEQHALSDLETGKSDLEAIAPTKLPLNLTSDGQRPVPKDYRPTIPLNLSNKPKYGCISFTNTLFFAIKRSNSATLPRSAVNTTRKLTPDPAVTESEALGILAPIAILPLPCQVSGWRVCLSAPVAKGRR
jgi:hypothetical protein